MSTDPATAGGPAPTTPHSLRASAFRFLLAGGLNTALTGLALSLLAQVVDPRLAYTVVFAAGVALSVALAGRFVFGVRMSRRHVLLYVAMYLAVYLVGLAVVAAATAAGMPDAFSGLVVLVTAPLTFVGGRLLLVRREATPAVEGTHP